MPRRICVLALVVITWTARVPYARSSPVNHCFSAPGIGDCLSGRFAQYWQASGGLPVFGYPITPVHDAATRDGAVMAQMLERNRLEYHPELAPPYDILLGRLGEDVLAASGRNWRTEPAGTPQAGCWYAAETQHTVCDQEPGRGFLTFYRKHGLDLGDPGISEREALALWGLPLTEPAMETNAAGDRVLTQWFERARFEYHTAKPVQYRVLLGLLGSEAWGSQLPPPLSRLPIPPGLGQPPVQPTLPPATRPLPTATPARAMLPPMQDDRSPIAQPSPYADLALLKQRLFDLVNVLHQEAGCTPLIPDERLNVAAQAHAADIAARKRIDHSGADGAPLRLRLERAGYHANRASESIAIYRSPEEVVARWMDEQPDGPHRLNITNCQYSDAGFGIGYDDRGRHWWVMDVASPQAGR